MRKDHILTTEEKLSKQQRLEENRRIRSKQINNNNIDDTKIQTTAESPSIHIEYQSVGEKTDYQTQYNICYR